MEIREQLVSIVIPCYNHAGFLAETIESALAQTHQDLEIIVVDDGSTDASADVATRYPVRLLRQPNQGVAVAMNNGIRASSGAFALTLGSDDLLRPEYVERMLDSLRGAPGASFAYSRILFFGTACKEYPTEPFDPETLAQRNYVAAVALFRREAFDQVGGFDPAMPRCEDWDFWLTLAERGHQGMYVPQLLVLGRQQQRSYNSRHYFSLRGIRRELQMATRLRDKHPRLFARPALLRRLAHLPERVVRHEVSPRVAALLVAFYASMLVTPSSSVTAG
jgi:glycosyltransferase involved in cell wall biosynthesis